MIDNFLHQFSPREILGPVVCLVADFWDVMHQWIFRFLFCVPLYVHQHETFDLLHMLNILFCKGNDRRHSIESELTRLRVQPNPANQDNLILSAVIQAQNEMFDYGYVQWSIFRPISHTTKRLGNSHYHLLRRWCSSMVRLWNFGKRRSSTLHGMVAFHTDFNESRWDKLIIWK